MSTSRCHKHIRLYHMSDATIVQMLDSLGIGESQSEGYRLGSQLATDL